MPRLKRTSAEVAEAKAKKDEILQRLEELDKQKKIALAEMELEEEEEDIEEEKTAVRHVEDLQDAEIDEFDPLPLAMDEDEPLQFPSSSDEDEPMDTEDDYSEPKADETKPVTVSVWVLKLSFILTDEDNIEEEKGCKG